MLARIRRTIRKASWRFEAEILREPEASALLTEIPKLLSRCQPISSHSSKDPTWHGGIDKTRLRGTFAISCCKQWIKPHRSRAPRGARGLKLRCDNVLLDLSGRAARGARGLKPLSPVPYSRD